MILPLLLSTTPIMGCRAVDGDTLRCGAERVRLLAIDSPEMHGCPRNRVCVEGDAQAAKRNLERLIYGKTLRIERVKRDRYGRTIAVVYAGSINTSCAQIAGRYAQYIARFDDGKRIARGC